MSSTLAGEGSEAVFERLYRRHRGDVYRFVLRDVRNAADAEDVTQAAFLNAYRALKRGDEPEKPRAWLFTIAQNVARRRFRARAARPVEVELDPNVLAAPVAEGPTAAEIRDALRRLRPNHRAVIVLREVGGFSYAEIAETLGLTVSAVETQLFRARRALREQLAVEERRSLRAGALALPLPAGPSDWLAWLVAWFGRRVVAVKVAGALGAGVVATGVAVERGAVALPAGGGSVAAAYEPAPRASGDFSERRAHEPTAGRRATPGADAAARSGGRARTRAEPTGARDGALLGVSIPDVAARDVSLPEEVVPQIAVPHVPAVGAPAISTLTVELPPVSVPDADLPALPEAGTLLP